MSEWCDSFSGWHFAAVSSSTVPSVIVRFAIVIVSCCLNHRAVLCVRHSQYSWLGVSVLLVFSVNRLFGRRLSSVHIKPVVFHYLLTNNCSHTYTTYTLTFISNRGFCSQKASIFAFVTDLLICCNSLQIVLSVIPQNCRCLTDCSAMSL